jgi:AcrR family transcriptional regulator
MEWLVPMTDLSSVTSAGDTRERIRSVAGDLYVLRGHDGFSFADIAEMIGTTRANIHHHFGSKSRLMDELIEQFAADAVTRIEHHWAEGDLSFFDRMEAQLQDLRRFYTRFNRTAGDRNIWSPLSRLRHDLPVLGEPAARALERANEAYDRCLKQALSGAIASGELCDATPVEDLARVLRVILLSCPSMTQDSGSFAEIESLFTSTATMVSGAWGRQRTQ